MQSEISASMLEILVCPLCKGQLVYDQINQELTCYQSKLAYKIKDGIAIMLIDEARKIE
ncbi:MAG: Trm112 family protein [Alphaproteobacteria bacterium]